MLLRVGLSGHLPPCFDRGSPPSFAQYLCARAAGRVRDVSVGAAISTDVHLRVWDAERKYIRAGCLGGIC